MKLIRENGLKTEQWNSGSTTEIMIYPPGSIYSNRQFEWRLSIATIDEEQSLFTKLVGYTRTTMVLKGELTLHHVNRYTVHLKTLEQDYYRGDWETKSEGKVTNLNLITDSYTSSKIEVKRFFKKFLDYKIDFVEHREEKIHHLLMALEPIEVQGDLNVSLRKGDFLYLTEESLNKYKPVIHLYSEDFNIQFIHIQIYKNK